MEFIEIICSGSTNPGQHHQQRLAFRKSKALKYLNMDYVAFVSAVSLWRALNINLSDDAKRPEKSRTGGADDIRSVISRDMSRSKTTLFPLPPLVRIDPAAVSLWNTFKGGGDSATDLLDRFQERLANEVKIMRR